MQVSELWRYPVKSMQGERLEEAIVDEFGIDGDRAWALVDSETGLALTARREPSILYAAARVSGDGVVITLPDGAETTDDQALSAWFGRDVELQRATAQHAATYETQADETETGDWLQWTGPAGSFHDSTRTKISLVSQDAFRAWDPRRFRINIVLDAPGDLGLVGSQISVGETTLDVLKQIDRCVMTTRPQPAIGDLPPIARDLSVLRTINAENATFLGIGSVVLSGGIIRPGDALTVS